MINESGYKIRDSLFTNYKRNLNCKNGHLNVFAPDAGKGGLNLFFEAGDQFAVGVDTTCKRYNIRYYIRARTVVRH